MGRQSRQGPSREERADAVETTKSGAFWGRTGLVAGAIFLVLLAVYQADGDFLYGNDAKPNVYLSVALLSEGGFSFTPSQYPFMFYWAQQTLQGPVQRQFDHWDARVGDQPYTYRQLLQSGHLRVWESKYYLVSSVRKTPQGERMYVNTFGPGAGMTALPVFALLHVLSGGDLRSHPTLLWYGGKFVASVLVAGSVVFVFLTARAFTTARRAAMIALAYGLGTGVWSTSSQTLWQHGPNEFFLAMGTYFLLRAKTSWTQAAWCGWAFSAAVACRPTSVVVAAAVGAYLLVRRLAAGERGLLAYVLAALPIAIALGAYNAYYLGNPLEFGQAKVGHAVALSKTGSEDLWQTPLAEGAAGLMVSPSRGLLVFSPFMAFALVGLVVLWRQKRYAALWPVTLAMLVLLGIAFKWFDWWGGWCYGPRPIVDTMPFLALGLIPVIDWICRRKAILVVFWVVLAWSAAVQALGVLTYDMFGWNSRTFGYEVYPVGGGAPFVVNGREELDRRIDAGQVRGYKDVRKDIDDAENRYRLWSLSDNQIGYYLTHFGETRSKRAEYHDIWLREPHR